MSGRIRKDVALITSGGRTGTSFFAGLLNRIVDDAFAVHEPDVWHGWRRAGSWRAIRWFGVYHVTLGKVLRRTGMRAVMERYLSGEWSPAEAAAAVVRQRRRFYRERDASLVVESNAQWYGLLPLMPRVLESYRVLALVRDPRTWVRSWANYGGHHDAEDPVVRLGLPRVSPRMVGGAWADRWDEMDVFQRLCWDWRFITSRLVEAVERDPAVRLVRFEDLFYGAEGPERLDQVLGFLTDFGHRRYAYRVPEDVFERRVNPSREERMEPWDRWPQERRRFLAEMCGPLMERVGYALDEPPRRGPGVDG